MFENAIVRKPCPSMIEGLTTANLGKPDYKKALKQHETYTEILESCGLNVEILKVDNRFPDSTFVEDVALCTPICAVITNPGAKSRRGEISEMREILGQYYNSIEEIKSTGTLDAGDVMMVENHYYIGISERTNEQGANQLIEILQEYGMNGSKVPLKDVLHLKTGLSYIENNNLLVSGEFTTTPVFEKFNKIEIAPEEAYSANSLWINGKVLVPKGFRGTVGKIKAAGYPVIEIDVSEFQKIDGGLSCLSLRF